MIPAKTAESIKVLFGLWTQECPMNHVLGGGPDPPSELAILGKNGQPIVKHRDSLPEPSKKTAEPTEMPFGLWTRVGPRNNVLDGGHEPPWKGAILVGEGCPL